MIDAPFFTFMLYSAKFFLGLSIVHHGRFCKRFFNIFLIIFLLLPVIGFDGAANLVQKFHGNPAGRVTQMMEDGGPAGDRPAGGGTGGQDRGRPDEAQRRGRGDEGPRSDGMGPGGERLSLGDILNLFLYRREQGEQREVRRPRGGRFLHAAPCDAAPKARSGGDDSLP